MCRRKFNAGHRMLPSEMREGARLVEESAQRATGPDWNPNNCGELGERNGEKGTPEPWRPKGVGRKSLME